MLCFSISLKSYKVRRRVCHTHLRFLSKVTFSSVYVSTDDNVKHMCLSGEACIPFVPKFVRLFTNDCLLITKNNLILDTICYSGIRIVNYEHPRNFIGNWFLLLIIE